MTDNYRTKAKSRLLRQLDKAVGRVRYLLVSHYGEEQIGIVLNEALQKYEALIPQIPYLGARNPSALFLTPTTRYLAIYRALEVHGKTVEEAGQLAYAMAEASLNAIPGFVRRAMGYLWFSSLFRGRLKRRAAESQKREYPGGFVFSFVEGDGRTFDYAESVNENETPTVWN
jgi:hypothetical protein